MIEPRILVTGGTGFIGYHLLKAVRSLGWNATSVSLRPPVNERFVEGVRYLCVDLTDAQEVKKYLSEEFEYVVNLGGYIDHILFRDGGKALIQSHFVALQTLVEFLPRDSLRRFVQIGSSDEYGDSVSPQHEEMREKAISPYSLAKVSSAHFLQMLHRTEGYPAVVLRLFLTYGPGQDAKRFLPQIIRGCLQDKKFPTSAGMQLRDFCYVEDSVNAIIKAMLTDESTGHVINIASGQPISVRKIIEQVMEKVGKGEPEFGALPYRIGENMSLFANIEKAERVLDWRPAVTLDQGLEKTIRWYERYE